MICRMLSSRASLYQQNYSSSRWNRQPRPHLFSDNNVPRNPTQILQHTVTSCRLVSVIDIIGTRFNKFLSFASCTFQDPLNWWSKSKTSINSCPTRAKRKSERTTTELTVAIQWCPSRRWRSSGYVYMPSILYILLSFYPPPFPHSLHPAAAAAY